MKKILLTLLMLMISMDCYAINLTDALVHSYNNNPELISKREELKSIDETKFTAMAEFLPKVYFVSGVNKDKRNRSADILDRQSDVLSPWLKRKDFTNKFVLEQNLFKGGGSLAALESAKYKVEQGRADLNFTEQNVLLNTVRAYAETVFRKGMLDINKNNVESLQKYLAATKARFEAGFITKTDVALSEANLAKAQSDLIAADGQYNNALANFRKEVGLEAENLEIVFDAPEIPENLQDALDVTLKLNPQLISVKRAKAAAEVDVKSVVASMWPTLSMSAEMGDQYTKRYASAAQRVGSENNKTNYKSVNLQLVVPIYQQGVEYSNSRKVRANLARATSEVRRVTEALKNLTTQSWTSHRSAIATRTAAAKAENSYKIALDGLMQEYQEGIKSVIELLDSRTKYFNSQMQLLQAERDIKVTGYMLKASVGKLTAKDLGLPTQIYDPTENYNKINFKLIGF